MTDIVDRLRARAGEYGDMAQAAPEISQFVLVYSMSLEAAAAAMDEAAEEIERLRGAVANAVEIAIRYGGTDGEHHKAWVIDQIVRSLTHCPKVKTSAIDYKGNAYEYDRLGESEEYTQLIADACDGVDGPETYSWDCGVAP